MEVSTLSLDIGYLAVYLLADVLRYVAAALIAGSFVQGVIHAIGILRR